MKHHMLLTALLAGCASYPPIDAPGACDQYGVKETDRKLGTVVVARELYQDELDRVCAGVEIAEDQTRAGCTIPYPDGSVEIYWRHDDVCAERHERCHAAHGPEHTAEYADMVERGHPLPHCPDVLR